MRFLGLAVMTGAVMVMSACGGGDKAAEGSGAAVTPAPDTTAMMATPPATGAAAISGTTHEVKMIGDATGYKFDPADITIKAGDGIRFTMVSGGPHNVAFDPATLSAPVKATLLANMPEQMGELSGKMLITPNETYTISFAGVPAGTYDYHCTPHLAMNMKGKITIQ